MITLLKFRLEDKKDANFYALSIILYINNSF